MPVPPLRIETAISRFYNDAGVQPSSGGVVPVYDLLDRLPGLVEVHEIPGFTHAQAADFLLGQRGHRIDVDRADDRRLAGLVYATRVRAAFVAHVFVRAEDPVTRRRFTIGHEIGHVYLHFLSTSARAFVEVYDHGGSASLDNGPAGQAEPDPDGYSRAQAYGDGPDDLPDYATMEAEANAFSAALLMPDAACRSLADALAPTYGDRRAVLARRMAPDFLVSKTAMRNRLRTLDIGSED